MYLRTFWPGVLHNLQACQANGLGDWLSVRRSTCFPQKLWISDLPIRVFAVTPSAV